MNKIIQGDCLEEMKKLEAGSVDTIITDPPYGLEFMGKKWDYDVPSVEVFQEMLRVAKSGATLLCFAGTRTQHRMAVNIEDAGWILKDCLMWLYGSGFPKATDVKKSGEKAGHDMKGWNGWKSHGLKPAYEPIIMAMKPNDGSYANNALKHGVSGLNIDGGRISLQEHEDTKRKKSGHKTHYIGGKIEKNYNIKNQNDRDKGRFSANILLDEEAAEEAGEWKRYFYVAKASKAERNRGLAGYEEHEEKVAGGMQGRQDGSLDGKIVKNFNNHPTVKPIKLMEYLCTLTKTPTAGIVLDPYAGSGTTCLAAKRTGRQYIGIEREEEYVKIAKARLKAEPDKLL